MSVHPVPSAFEARCNATFEAVMWALSRPGLSREMPGPGMAQIAEALIDRECAVHCADPALAERLAQLGARLVGLAEADHVFVESVTPELPMLLRQGSDLHPEDGVTLIAPAVLGEGPEIQLTGPGVDGAVRLPVGGLPAGFWQARKRAMRYPMGFELLLVDGARMLGVPRSTTVEAL